jgi:hypothetical protein
MDQVVFEDPIGITGLGIVHVPALAMLRIPASDSSLFECMHRCSFSPFQLASVLDASLKPSLVMPGTGLVHLSFSFFHSVSLSSLIAWVPVPSY